MSASEQQWPSAEELGRLDQRVQRAFRGQDEEELEVLGYGEISAVLALRCEHGSYACKRLPPFTSSRARDDYRGCFEQYIAALAEHGVVALDSALIDLEGDEGPILYCVQPLIDGSRLAVEQFRHQPEDRRLALFRGIRTAITTSVGPRLGLDGQLSNWLLADDGSLRYLDLTTPLLRDEHAREGLDLDLFVRSLPWVMRPVVRRFMLAGILDTYYDPRQVLVDLLANLHKERLTGDLPALLEIANEGLSRAIDTAEVERYYRADARTWELLLRLRRWDRAWQRRIRRRPYPVLLPGPIQR